MNKSSHIVLFILTCIFCIAAFFICGNIFKPNDIIIKETDDYIYVKEYTMYGNDSAIYKYHKQIVYIAKVKDKYKKIAVRHGFFDVLDDFKVIYEINGKIKEINNKYIFENVNIGDEIIFIERFYPYHVLRLSEINKK